MQLIFSGVVVVTNIVLIWKQREIGLKMFCILALVFPLIPIQNIKISYEILAGSALIAEEAIYHIVNKNFKFYKMYGILFFIMAIYGFATLISALYWNCNVLYATLYGAIRLGLLLIIFTQTKMIENIYRSVLKWALVINVLTVIVQVFIKDSYIFFEWCYRKGSGPYDVLEKTWKGNYNRCFGTFSTPTVLSYLASLATIYFLYELLMRKKEKDTSFLLTLAVVCGMAGSMRQYYVSLIICIVAGIIGAIGYKIIKRVTIISMSWEKIRSLSIIMLLCLAIGYIMDVNGVNVIDNFLGSFSRKRIEAGWEARYDREEGLASIEINSDQYDNVTNNSVEEGADSAEKNSDQYDSAINNSAVKFSINNIVYVMQKMIGVGATAPLGKTVIDSQWMVFLWQYGIVSTIIIITWFLYQIYIGLRWQRFNNILYILLICVLGMVTGSVLCFLGIITIAYIAKNDFKEGGCVKIKKLPFDSESKEDHFG